MCANAFAAESDPPLESMSFLPALMEVSHDFQCLRSSLNGKFTYKSREKADQTGYEYSVASFSLDGRPAAPDVLADLNKDLPGKSIISVAISCQKSEVQVMISTWDIGAGENGLITTTVSSSGTVVDKR